jgi:hypothetical protein
MSFPIMWILFRKHWPNFLYDELMLSKNIHIVCGIIIKIDTLNAS